MADWNTSYNWMMDNEDYPRACRQVPDAGPADAGPCYAISGINSAAWPNQFASIAAIPQDGREPAVQQGARQAPFVPAPSAARPAEL